MYLTIAVLTMNRSRQLKEAIESVIACKLPEETEIVVLDNASTDDTRTVIEELKNKSYVPIEYYYSSVNTGVGGGRAKLFDYAKGKYVYFLDDDAIISPDFKDTFFTESLDYMDNNTNVASMTTQIYDEIFGFSRTDSFSNKILIGGKPVMFNYLGGSHFLRKSCFNSPLYFKIKYGSEEYAPSIIAMDNGYYHVFNKDISIIHKPKRNKWVHGTDEMRGIRIKEVAIVYATKKILYPLVFQPILYLGYKKRSKMYLSMYPGATKDARKMVREIVRENKCKKIHIISVIKMFKIFGMTVF